MKKILALMLAVMTVVSLTACGSTGSGDKGGDKPGDTMSLTEMADKLYEGISEDQLPMMLTTTELTADMYEGVLFIPAIEGAEAVSSESMVGSIAHSVALLRLPEGSDVEAVRADIEKNMNPAKWICVQAEKTGVIAHGNTILMVMTDAAKYDTIVKNFDALWA